MHVSNVSLNQFQSLKIRTGILQSQTKHNILEQPPVRHGASHGLSMPCDESDNSYATDACDCLVDRNFRHTGIRTFFKLTVQWYVYRLVVETIKEPGDTPRHNTARYKLKQRKYCKCLLSAQKVLRNANC